MTQPAQTWMKVGTIGRAPSRGSAAVGALALGASKDVVVAIAPTMPDTGYTPVATIAGSASLLGAVSVQGIVATTTTSVTVRVQANSVLSAGITVNVVAVK